MEVPVGFLAKLWSFLSFLPFFISLFILGLLKAAIVGPIVVCIILIGNAAIIVGLWPAHLLWTFYCVARTKRLGVILKILALISLPVPLVLWLGIGIIGSLLSGLGYGIFTPLMATFEAVGEDVTDKFYHCFVQKRLLRIILSYHPSGILGYTSFHLYKDGSWSAIQGSCTVVRDLMDFCFHSYFSFMDELSEKMPENERPMDIRLSKLPSCLVAILIGVPVDVLFISAIALLKSPYMLLRGWKRLIEDLIGREGPFLETVCVPFAGLAIILWPLAVMGAVVAAVISSFFLGFYSGVIVHQEGSLCMGLAYVVSVISLFDEYVNDLLYLREGSCLPRPRYRTKLKPLAETKNCPSDSIYPRNGREDSYNSRVSSQQSRTLKRKIQQYRPVQVWDWLFISCEVNGRILLREGLIDIKDVEECILRGNCKKLGIKLPAWSILQCLLTSAKSNSSGLTISDEIELTLNNGPQDRVFEWFVGPLLIIKDQIKGLQLSEDEDAFLRKLVMRCKNEKPEDWDDTGFPCNDTVKRAQLQAIIRRLQGIVASMSRIPTFRRRFRNLVKVLYLEALQAGASDNKVGGILRTWPGSGKLTEGSGDQGEESVGKGHRIQDEMV